MLHQDANINASIASTSGNTNDSTNTVLVSSHASNQRSTNKAVLLATALVLLRTKAGKEVRARALLDQGSEATFLSSSLQQRLGITGTKSYIPIAGIGSVDAGIARQRVSLELLSLVEPEYALVFEALVLPKLTSVLPAQTIKFSKWTHTQNLPLADPEFYKSQKIDLILGADVYAQLIQSDVIHGPAGTPTAQKTHLGWLLTGIVQNPLPTKETRRCLHAARQEDLSGIITKFWEMEEVPSAPSLTADEQECIKIYEETTRRDQSGRYSVRLPRKSTTTTCLGETRFGAVKLLKCMERRFSNDAALAHNYLTFMNEYRDLQHMHEILNLNEDDPSKQICYLPHHAVLKEESSSTKLRVVFNASYKTATGTALNDILHTGPKQQHDVLQIILRWRQHLVAFSSDIEKMYRQIQVHEEDQYLQRIVWRNTPYEPIRDYRLATVTYGMGCAPFLAIKTLHRLAEDEQVRFPLGAKTLISDTYVDDILAGAETVQDALELQRQLIGILKAGGFNLRKWTSNQVQLLEHLNSDQRLHQPLELTLDKEVRTLGIEWHPVTDEFSYRVRLDCDPTPTKRRILSTIARLYDPLGWLSPVTINAKTLMQKLWTAGVTWDEPLSCHLEIEWQLFRNELPSIESVRIPRWIGTLSRNLVWEIHGFADSSEAAYAAVVYVRVGHDLDNIQVSLLAAKTRVAPLKRVTIPRLELCATVLLARLIDYVRKALNALDAPTYAWTDSTTVLAWVRSQPHRWKTFVANRVAEIQSLLKGNYWRYVPSAQNPADCASRGIPPSNLKDHPLWWHGPSWLSKPSTCWPSQPSAADKSLISREEKPQKMVHITTVNEVWDLLERYSTLTKLLRVTAYVMRFTKLLRYNDNSQLKGPLLPIELDEALSFWVKQVQHTSFYSEVESLKAKGLINPKSKLLRLQPTLDNNDLLRVGGRLENSQLCLDRKHPLILPKQSSLSTLIIRNAHLATLHGGENDTIAYVLQKYWILGLRRAVRSTIGRCVTCFRYRAKTSAQIMGSLPKERVTPSRAFQHSGVDYAGPIALRVSKGRGQKTFKGYIALFICFSTKAVHLEIVSDATSHAFIAAYKRFVSRRGIPSSIFSDNATTFVGSSKELQRNSQNFWKQFHTEIAEALSTYGTTWRFIPAASPHFGGLWEANIKCVKNHLKRTIGDTILTYEELTTIIDEIEACLNSRPLWPLTSDTSSIEVLTPGHFLIGAPLNTVPEPSSRGEPINRLSRWQLLQRLVENFWSKWSNEYLQLLQTRTKWNTSSPQPKVGDIVLVREDRLPPSRWLLGRITKLHPGADGLTRVVTLKANQSTFKRPITKICLLPTNADALGQPTLP